MVASVGANKPLRYNADMTFVIVPPDQPRVNVKITEYRRRIGQGAVSRARQLADRGLAGLLPTRGQERLARRSAAECRELE